MESNNFEIMDNKRSFDNYLIWNKNIPYLYDNIRIQALDYTTSSVSWSSSNNLFVGYRPTYILETGEIPFSKNHMLSLSLDNNKYIIDNKVDLDTDASIRIIKSYDDDAYVLLSNKTLAVVKKNQNNDYSLTSSINLNESNDMNDYFCFDKCEEYIALGGLNGEVKLINIEKNTAESIEVHRNIINDVKWSIIPNILITGSDDRCIKM